MPAYTSTSRPSPDLPHAMTAESSSPGRDGLAEYAGLGVSEHLRRARDTARLNRSRQYFNTQVKLIFAPATHVQK